MKIPIALLPSNIIKHYQLQEKVLDGYFYMEICKGMYGLPQAGILANKLLKERLAHHGYFKQPHMPELWKHVTCPVWFNLCVDNFGIKYIGRGHLQLYMIHYERKHIKLWKIGQATYIAGLH
jgi:hypothetical protein